MPSVRSPAGDPVSLKHCAFARPKTPACVWFGQNIPSALVMLALPVVRGFRSTLSAPLNSPPPAWGGQSWVVVWVAVFQEVALGVQAAAGGYGIARGGPKKQLSTAGHELAVPPQSASVVQRASGLGAVQAPPVPQPVALKHVAPGVGPPLQVPALMQWLDVVLDPFVQSRLVLVPLLATSVLPGPMLR